MKLALAMLLATLSFGGCGKKSEDAKPAVVASGDCTSAVNTAIDTIVAKSKAGGTLAPARAERFEKLRVAMTTRCSDDKWPPPMLACVTAMQVQADLVRCMGNLDAASMQKLQADLGATILGGGMRGPGGPDGSGASFRPHSFNIVQAFEKRLGELDTRIANATKAIADAKTDADRATANAELERLNRERVEVAKQLEGIKASHGGELAPTVPGSVPAPGSAHP